VLANRTTRLGAVLPCLLAPLALFFPWAIVPSHIGLGAAGWPFFREWLTKHPNLGPINWEVAAGIVCVVAASWLPFAFGAHVVSAERPRRLVLGVLAAASFCVYAAVLVRLDFVFFALLAGRLRGASPFFDVPASVCVGAVMRALAFANILVVCYTVRRSHGRRSEPHP
jgi:hypothetical protein